MNACKRFCNSLVLTLVKVRQSFFFPVKGASRFPIKCATPSRKLRGQLRLWRAARYSVCRFSIVKQIIYSGARVRHLHL